ncbi:aegerolysin family protein [Streptomyces cyaneofuscatus]|uniref:aegerolysin family protein n=1 Tax=Streptomyces TaxID=1883 RepID=UPI002FF11BF7
MKRLTRITDVRRAAAGALTAVLMAAGAVALAPAAQAVDERPGTRAATAEQRPTKSENKAKGQVGVTAARSTQVKLINYSGTNLVKTWDELPHGCWTTDMLPPDTVANGAQPIWQSESCGFMTGTEGKVTYALPGGGEVRMHWNNPYSGSNSYSCVVPAGYQCDKYGGSGNNASVTFDLWKKASAAKKAPGATKARGAAANPLTANAARSTNVTLTNVSGRLLTRSTSQLHWGIWSTNMLPPSIIQSGVSGNWQSESDGFMTGTEGEVSFNVSGETNKVKVYWNNPYSGSNRYSCTAPSGFDCTHQGGSGNNATVAFTLTKQ